MLWTHRLCQVFLLVRRRGGRQGVLVWWTSNPSTSSRLEAFDFALYICRVRLVDCIKVRVCIWNWLFSFVFSNIMIESIISHIRVCWNFSHTQICLLHWMIFFWERDDQNHVQILSKRRAGFPGSQLPHTHTHAQYQATTNSLWMPCQVFFLDYIVSLFSYGGSWPVGLQVNKTEKNGQAQVMQFILESVHRHESEVRCPRSNDQVKAVHARAKWRTHQYIPVHIITL